MNPCSNEDKNGDPRMSLPVLFVRGRNPSKAFKYETSNLSKGIS